MPAITDAARTDIPAMDAVASGDDPCDPRVRADGGSAFTDAASTCPLPNLIPVIQNIQVQTRVFGPSSCEVAEGCTQMGRRRLLRFDLLTPNIGRGDLYLGPPVVDNRPDGRFEYGACHGHYHFRGYADYRLLDSSNREMGMGHKQSFCLLDSFRYMGMGRNVPLGERYTCADQGIHAGWYDLYDRALDCQFVDVTALPPGEYTLRVRINELRGLTEASYDDNETTMRVTLGPEGADAGMPEINPTDACPDGASIGPTRDCGWVVERGATCRPGQMVTVGCNAMCSPAIGSCNGNPVIRVCPGDGPCVHANMVAENDDACGTQCPSVTFMCPLIQRYTVMTGASRGGNAYECRVDLR